MTTAKNTKKIELTIHIIAWLVLLSIPIFSMEKTANGLAISDHFVHHQLAVIVCILIAFYVNYLFLIPHFLFDKKRKEKTQFLIINIVLKVRVAKITMKKKEIINISLHYRFRCLTLFWGNDFLRYVVQLKPSFIWYNYLRFHVLIE